MTTTRAMRRRAKNPFSFIAKRGLYRLSRRACLSLRIVASQNVRQLRAARWRTSTPGRETPGVKITYATSRWLVRYYMQKITHEYLVAKNDPSEGRTRDLRFRRATRYPLRQRALTVFTYKSGRWHFLVQPWSAGKQRFVTTRDFQINTIPKFFSRSRKLFAFRICRFRNRDIFI